MDTEPADAVTASLVMLVPAVMLMSPLVLLTEPLPELLLLMAAPAFMVIPAPALMALLLSMLPEVPAVSVAAPEESMVP